MLDRKSIEKILERVAAGDITIEQATASLIETERETQSSANPTEISMDAEYLESTNQVGDESLASLIRRLGSVPPDIADYWCEQFSEYVRTGSYAEARFTPNRTSLDQWQIKHDGSLHLSQLTNEDGGNRRERSGEISAEELDQAVSEFRAHLTCNSDDHEKSQRIEKVAKVNEKETKGKFSASLADHSLATVAPDSLAPDKEPSFTQRDSNKRWMKPSLAVLLVLAIVGAGWIMLQRSGNELASTDGQPNQRENSTFIPKTNDSPNVNTIESIDSLIEAEDLQTLESLTEAEIAGIENSLLDPVNGPMPSFDLGSLKPAMQTNSNVDANRSESRDSQSISATVTDSTLNNDTGVQSPSQTPSTTSAIQETINQSEVLGGGLPQGDLMTNEDDEAPEPSESIQPTLSTSTYVTLPPPDQLDEVSIASLTGDTKSLELAFPAEFALSLLQEDDTSGWKLMDERLNTSIGHIRATESELSFRWNDNAAESSVSSMLQHGKIRIAGRSAVYLRPEIKADPWLISLQSADTRPTWDLTGIILPRSARLNVLLELPVELEKTWVQPIEPENVRKALGAIIVKQVDTESVALGIKFDIRCSRKISCRVRYVAQLDPTLPWQVVSRSAAEQYANQLANQADLISREAERLSAVYSIAGTQGKRIIRVKQARNDAFADQVKTVMTRVSELESLIAIIESEAKLQLRLDVVWPESRQTIFTSFDDGPE